MEIVKNLEHNGIEIYFDARPTSETITQLKQKFFRWHNIKKCWFAKATDDNVNFAESLNNGEQITVGTTETTPKKESCFVEIVGEEKHNILSKLYCNNYLERLRETDTKYYNKVLAEELLLKTKDNYIIKIDISKPTIDKTLWYDDELPKEERPTKSEEYFISYNMHNFDYDHFLEEGKVKKLSLAWNDNKTICYLQRFYRDEFVRKLTEEEQSEMLTILQNLKDEYIKRLKNYYKRYNDCIYCQGYWVNR